MDLVLVEGLLWKSSISGQNGRKSRPFEPFSKPGNRASQVSDPVTPAEPYFTPERPGKPQEAPERPKSIAFHGWEQFEKWTSKGPQDLPVPQ